jgi:hypothetical protein
MRPGAHAFVGSRVVWYDPAASLPEFPEYSPMPALDD